MRVVKRVVIRPPGFSFQLNMGRAERNGVERSRARNESWRLYLGLRSVILFLNASVLLSFRSCVPFARREFACLPDRCRRFVLCWPTSPHPSSYPDS